jgi:hypothetical protein
MDSPTPDTIPDFLLSLFADRRGEVIEELPARVFAYSI